MRITGVLERREPQLTANPWINRTVSANMEPEISRDTGGGLRHRLRRGPEPMAPDDFRRMALALEGAVEWAHMGHPDFRVNNRIFATLHSGDRFGMVALSPEEQGELIGAHPAMFAPEAGAWGRAGSTRVHLASVDPEVLGEALTLAWQNAVRKGRPKESGRSRGRKPK
jgi:hypothetical protein